MTDHGRYSERQLLEDLRGDHALLAQLIDAYLVELNPTLHAITTADRAGQWAGLAARIHQIRGSFAVLRADRGRALAEAMERQLAAGHAPAPGAVPALIDEARHVAEVLLAWRGRHPV
jgi:HPt (histidine-containing phosphotransfer) domain-containing protein